MDIRRFRKLHRTIAPIVLLPLLVTVFTGVTYRLGKSWFGLSRDRVHFLMTIHEGEYLGDTLEPLYVLLNGLGLLWMLITGGMMLWQSFSQSKWFRQFRSATEEAEGDGETG
ncbi:PepSY domain-containing protein [Lusitaniella coriacea LEGE 07157]|uniref:PepSY domain-containing protein n=1 Tax=Lusitaniella coriacea LEGE 07157 TaxID=945747 RepID=A0A8J7E0C0_9CYAN|nr:PepSY domain-containing protein [Lusitaniella coriacea]MBE9118748.1 PepSY domain-containing protein [Lusitaniella coriacea LEGE 07157]